MAAGSVTTALGGALHQLFRVYFRWLLLLALIAYAVSGMYKIGQDSVGVLTRFGKIVEPAVTPGLHYKLPWPIDRVHILPVREVKTLVINDFSSAFSQSEGGKSYLFYKKTGLEPYAITGDDNIVGITLVLKYTIEDPAAYLFAVRQPELLLERRAAREIVRNLAGLKIDEVLTFGKKQLEFTILKNLSTLLAEKNSGLHVSFLEIREINPPRKVQDAFTRVINAGVEKRKMRHQAQGHANRIVPEARTAANRIVQEARAYKQEKILTAQGEASRFLARFKGYQENPQAQQNRIHLDFISKLYPALGEIRVLDSARLNQKLEEKTKASGLDEKNALLELESWLGR